MPQTQRRTPPPTLTHRLARPPMSMQSASIPHVHAPPPPQALPQPGVEQSVATVHTSHLLAVHTALVGLQCAASTQPQAPFTQALPSVCMVQFPLGSVPSVALMQEVPPMLITWQPPQDTPMVAHRFPI